MVQAWVVRAALQPGRALLVTWVLGSSGVAGGAETPLRLDAPPECPPLGAWVASVRDLVGREPDLSGVSLQIDGSGSAWHAALTLPEGERTLAGESCSALMEASAVVVALALERRSETKSQDLRSVGPLDVSVAASSIGAEPPKDPLASAGPPLEPPRKNKKIRLRLHVGMMAEVGLLPGPSLGPRMRMTFERGAWSADLAGAVLLARHAELRTGESAEIYWFAAQAAACRNARGGLRACFGGEAGQIVGTGFGVEVPVTARGSWLAATADASFRGLLADPFSWELGLGVAAAFVLPEFGFDELGVLHRPSTVSGRFFASLGWQ